MTKKQPSISFVFNAPCRRHWGDYMSMFVRQRDVYPDLRLDDHCDLRNAVATLLMPPLSRYRQAL